jgi:hypothetical protein
MRRSAVFFDAFLDGFAMAGFLTQLRQPGAATHICSPSSSSVNAGWAPLDLKPVAEPSLELPSAESVRLLPDPMLHAMMEVLQREDSERKSALRIAGGTEYGATR